MIEAWRFKLSSALNRHSEAAICVLAGWNLHDLEQSKGFKSKLLNETLGAFSVKILEFSYLRASVAKFAEFLCVVEEELGPMLEYQAGDSPMENFPSGL